MVELVKMVEITLELPDLAPTFLVEIVETVEMHKEHRNHFTLARSSTNLLVEIVGNALGTPF